MADPNPNSQIVPNVDMDNIPVDLNTLNADNPVDEYDMNNLPSNELQVLENTENVPLPTETVTEDTAQLEIEPAVADQTNVVKLDNVEVEAAVDENASPSATEQTINDKMNLIQFNNPEAEVAAASIATTTTTSFDEEVEFSDFIKCIYESILKCKERIAAIKESNSSQDFDEVSQELMELAETGVQRIIKEMPNFDPSKYSQDPENYLSDQFGKSVVKQEMDAVVPDNTEALAQREQAVTLETKALSNKTEQIQEENKKRMDQVNRLLSQLTEVSDEMEVVASTNEAKKELVEKARSIKAKVRRSKNLLDGIKNDEAQEETIE